MGNATGDPTLDSTLIGPLANPTQFERVSRYLDIGKTEARLVCGGTTAAVGTGAVVPTIFADVPDDAVIMQEEIFGPVGSFAPFETLEEVIERANDSLYGLAAGVWSNNINTYYGPPSGSQVITRKHFKRRGTREFNVSAICDEGTACYAQQDWDKAEACYRRALSLDPNHVVTMCCLAWLLLNHKQDIIGARGLMVRAAEINPHHPYVMWHKHMFV